jgi:small redox-active disulfide protein 2
MISIKVLGPGCANCRKVEQAVKEAVTTLGMEADIEKVTDYGEILAYDVLVTPGLVINGKVVNSGRVPSIAEVTSWIADAADVV